jgi:APA family basic amino acid/polyamine antiporter
MFAYGGWQTATFMSGELKRPGRDLAIGLVAGVLGVIAIYVAVNVVCLMALGTNGLAATTTPASSVMRLAFGPRGAQLIALGIAISTLGFLSQGMLTAPRVYYAMANDKLFFNAVARVHPTTRVPIIAIALQGAAAIVIALSGTYEQILGYVVSTDFLFFGLTGLAVFRFRGRAAAHPIGTVVFVIACWAVVAGTVVAAPVNSAIGYGILMAGLPAYWYWRKRSRSFSGELRRGHSTR